MRLFLNLVLLFPSLVWAASGSAFKEVFFQSFNFILFVALLFFLVRKPLQAFYRARRENFLQFENMARKKEEKILTEHKGWRKKLEEMKGREQTVSEKAHQEGERFKAEKARELQELKERKKREAQFFLRLESEKMKREMLQKFKSNVVAGALEEFKTLGANPAFHKKLYGNFLRTIERQS